MTRWKVLKLTVAACSIPAGIIVGLCLLGSWAVYQGYQDHVIHAQVTTSLVNKVWSYEFARDGYNELWYIEDLETGTRCYAVVTPGSQGGSAISCVKK
jgi:hypothetical protein